MCARELCLCSSWIGVEGWLDLDCVNFHPHPDPSVLSHSHELEVQIYPGMRLIPWGLSINDVLHAIKTFCDKWARFRSISVTSFLNNPFPSSSTLNNFLASLSTIISIEKRQKHHLQELFSQLSDTEQNYFKNAHKQNKFDLNFGKKKKNELFADFLFMFRAKRNSNMCAD